MTNKLASNFDIIEAQKNLIYSALEGGSTYWCAIKISKEPADKTNYKCLADTPFCDGELEFFNLEDDTSAGILNKEALDRGWGLMHQKYTRHIADVYAGNGDATTGDVYLQMCLFGDIIYG